MFELPIPRYDAARPLFAPLEHHLGPQAILSGILPGSILVDDLDDPRAALTWLKHRVYLAGSPSIAFLESARRLLIENILPAASAAKRERYLLYFSPSSAEQAKELLSGLTFTQEWRLELEMRALQVDWRQLLPEKLLLQQIDADLLRSRGVIGKDSLIQALTAEHPSLQDALRHEFGYCLLRQRLIVARCLSEYAGNGRCEVGIVTHPEFRKQGLATIVACALVERAQFLGITRIGWHCWEKNRASSTLAQKIGFVLNLRYPVFTGKIV
jgi:GNAT superfamily N-acetyltransferase